MADGVVPSDAEDDELDVEELEDAAGGIVAPLEDINSGCTINGNCGCSSLAGD
ncbi:hypothetical protein [Longimicrobium sp.]|uniref:hypothetical protein n=1 Tax=Longimicrobium sp. TaxID=2029185 RepID=UPI003B3A7C87